MKMILFASALALGSVAYAQDATQPATSTMAPSGASAGAPGNAGQAPMGGSSAAPTSGDTSGGTSSGTGSAGGGMSGGSASGGMSSGGMAGGSAAASTDDSNLPMCSKTVTDKCKSGSGGAHHSKARHHKKK